jgi:hypothetical protein
VQSLPNLTGFLTVGTTACLTALGITIAKLAQHPVPGVRGFFGAKMPVISLPQIAARIKCMLRCNAGFLLVVGDALTLPTPARTIAQQFCPMQTSLIT